MTRNQPDEKPLQSWKEIAAYLDRDERTAMRWEKEGGLPVRRHRSSRRGSSVYAYPSEIDAWRAARPPQSQSEPPAAPLWRRPRVWVAAGVVAAAVLAIAYGPILNPRDPVAEAADDSMRTEQVWTGADVYTTTRISPDAKWLIYTAGPGEIWMREVASGENRQITNKGSFIEDRSYAETAALSPNGKQLAVGWYNDESGYELRIIPMPAPGQTNNGMAVFQPPPDQPAWVGAVGWLSDSKALFVHMADRTTTRLAIADLERDAVAVLKTFDWNSPGEVIISPDGRWIAYEFEDDIYVLATDGSSESVVVEHPAEDAPVAWTPDGSHLLFRSLRTPSQSLWAAPVDDGKLAGQLRLVSSEFSALGSLGVSPDGDLHYLKRTGSFDVYEARIDVAEGGLIESPKPIAATFMWDNFDPVYSPDGRWMAYLSNRNLGGRYASTRIVLRNLETGDERELAPTLPSIRQLAWSPDSSLLLFQASNRRGRLGIYSIGLTDGDAEKLLFLVSSKGEPSKAWNLFWMPDGRSVHYRDRYGPGGTHWIRDLETGAQQKVLSGKGHSIMTLSPDGSRFSVMEHLRDQSVVYLFTVDAQTGQQRELWRMQTPDGSLPPQVTAWTPDGATILFWKRLPYTRPAITELWTVPADGGEARKAQLVAEGLTRPVHTLSLHPDGERITFSSGNPQYEIWKLSNFLDRLGVSD